MVQEIFITEGLLEALGRPASSGTWASSWWPTTRLLWLQEEA